MKSAHEFAFYINDIPTSWDKNETVNLQDRVLAHRLQHVVRHKIGESLILFDAHRSAQAVVRFIDHKGNISFEIVHVAPHVPLSPYITVLVPLLKKEAFEQVIYSSVELGASEIYLMVTEKCHRSWNGPKELERLHAIMRAAAEQAKQFCLPILHAPEPLERIISRHDLSAIRYYADQYGSHTYQTLADLHSKKSSSLVISFGPEGDFSSTEKNILQSHNFLPVKLTPTTLRAPQAYTLFLGMIRSIL